MNVKTKPQTLRYKLSLFINRLSKTFFRDEFFLRKKIKPFIIIFLKLKYKRGFPVNIGGMQRVLFDPTFYFANWENFGGGHNSGFEECFTEAIKSSVFMDIGAHIGLYSIPIALRSPTTKVYSFEPAIFNFNMLSKHIMLNKLDNVEAFNVLVGETKSDTVAFLEDDTGINPMNSLADVSKTKENITTHKSMIQLDDFCRSKNILPEVMKIDVEGAEVQVIKGALETISKCRPKIFLSLHPKHIKALGDNTEDILKIFSELDYRIETYDGRDNSNFRDNEVLLIPRVHS